MSRHFLAPPGTKWGRAGVELSAQAAQVGQFKAEVLKDV